MRIGIDIDETLTDTSKSFDIVIKKYKINFKKDYSSEWDKSDFDFLKPYLEEILKNAKLKIGVKEAIKKLNLLGHKMYIITARSNYHISHIEEFTTLFLNQNGLKFNHIYYNQSVKSDLAKKLNLDLMIDDNIKIYNNMKKENIDCILFGDKIKKWEEVIDYINWR